MCVVGEGRGFTIVTRRAYSGEDWGRVGFCETETSIERGVRIVGKVLTRLRLFVPLGHVMEGVEGTMLWCAERIAAGEVAY